MCYPVLCYAIREQPRWGQNQDWCQRPHQVQLAIHQPFPRLSQVNGDTHTNLTWHRPSQNQKTKNLSIPVLDLSPTQPKHCGSEASNRTTDQKVQAVRPTWATLRQLWTSAFVANLVTPQTGKQSKTAKRYKSLWHFGTQTKEKSWRSQATKCLSSVLDKAWGSVAGWLKKCPRFTRLKKMQPPRPETDRSKLALTVPKSPQIVGR